MQITASASLNTEDLKYIELAQIAANEISNKFERAINSGTWKQEDIFDTDYIPIANTNPQQYLTKYLELSDKFLPEIQDQIIELDNNISFCAAVDKNGYLPTHNKKFSLQQRLDDIGWNTANCRNRRIFNDRVGLKAGANAGEPIIQIYRRDMGNSKFVMMKDISAPIFVNDRHWGGFRIGVRL